MLLAFDAAVIASALRRFPEAHLDRMEILIDTETRQMTLEITGLAEARAILEENGLHEGKDYTKFDAIATAGAVIIEMEAERE